MMVLENAERMHLERQVTLARVIFAALALVDLVEFRPPTGGGIGAFAVAGVERAWASAAFLAAYLGAALLILLYERGTSLAKFEFPLIVDFAVLACFLFLSPSLAAWWFLFLFLVFALATRGNSRAMLALVCVATVGIIIRIAATESFAVRSAWHWLAIGLATLISGLGMGFLGARERQHLERQQFLEKLSQLLQFDRGLTESVRQALGEIAAAFGCEQSCLAIRDEELERLFVWKIHPNEREPVGPETLALSRSETFLTDSLLAATIDAAGRPAGRVLLINPKRTGGAAKKFTATDLRWLEQIVRHIA